jgi:hypothetical protein
MKNEIRKVKREMTLQIALQAGDMIAGKGRVFTRW